MHARLVLILSTILGAHLTNATYHLRGALVTPAPRLNDLNARQADQCLYATDTLCPDGNACCPRGQPCTVIDGSPACDGTCSAPGPICPNNLCCNIGEACVLSAGNYYCSPRIINTFTLPKFTKITYATITHATDTFATETFPTETFPTATHDTITRAVTVSNIFTRSSESSITSSSSKAAMTESLSTSSESAALGSGTAVTPTTTIQSGEAPAASEPWFGILLSWFAGLLLMV